MQKVFGYIRVSGAGQVDGDGFTRQEKAISDYAEGHGLEVVEIFREAGVSGTLVDRPELARMLVSLEMNGHGVRTIVIEKMDRLARDLIVQEKICADLSKSGVELISTCEGADLLNDDPSRKLIRQIFGAVAEYDKSMTVLKLRAARDRKRADTGKCEGRKGYLTDYAEIVGAVMRLYKQRAMGRRRFTMAAIASRMNDDGYKTATGKLFTGQIVKNILHKIKLGKAKL